MAGKIRGVRAAESEQAMPGDTSKGKRLAVFVISELDNERALWRRIGSATTNADGSINVALDALPVNGRLHLRAVADAKDGD